MSETPAPAWWPMTARTLDRRRLLGRVCGGFAASQIGAITLGRGEALGATATETGPSQGTSSGSFGALKQVDAGALSVGYAETGPASGPVVILLHGWPYDIH